MFQLILHMITYGIMALFESARYVIDGREIESIKRDVDIATTIIGSARYSDDYTRSAGQSMMLAKNITNHRKDVHYFRVKAARASAADPAPAGYTKSAANLDVINTITGYNLGFATRVATLQEQRRQFACVIPLHHIFGFCKNVRKVINESKHSVVLVRKVSDDDAIWRDAGVSDGKDILSKLVLWMPVITPSITAEAQLLSFMDQGGKSLLRWLTVTTDIKEDNFDGVFTWNYLASQQGVSDPRHILVLQNTARLGSQERSHMIFNQIGVNEVSLRINGQQEPSEDILTDYTHKHIARVYHRMLSKIGRDQNVDTGLHISQLDFKKLYLIYYLSMEHLDLTRQSVIDIQFRTRVTRPGGIGNYKMVAVILSDKSMLLEGVGGRMRLLDAPVENL